MDNANEVIGANEQKTPFRQLPKEEQQRILDANQKTVREAPTLHEWDIRVPEAYAWIMISIVVGTMMLLFGGGSVYATDGNDWSVFYIVLGVSILMTFFLRFLVMADKDYHYRLTTEGVIVTYQDVIPEAAYTIVRGLAWFGVVVCVLAVALLGPLALVGAGGMALLAVFFTDFKSELHQEFTIFYKEWSYTLAISKRYKALQFEPTCKPIFGRILYCNTDDIPVITTYLKEHFLVGEIKNIKGHHAI